MCVYFAPARAHPGRGGTNTLGKRWSDLPISGESERQPPPPYPEADSSGTDGAECGSSARFFCAAQNCTTPASGISSRNIRVSLCA